MLRKATVKGFNKKSLVYLFLGIGIVVMMGTPNNDASAIITSLNFVNFIWLFIGGVVVAVALILPGISGILYALCFRAL